MRCDQKTKQKTETGTLEIVRHNNEEVLCYRPDRRYPARVHLFYVGGFLPKKIKQLLNHVKRN